MNKRPGVNLLRAIELSVVKAPARGYNGGDKHCIGAEVRRSAMDYETQRRLMCELGRRMWERGWVAANDGNFSRRLGEGLFLVTPAGVSKGFLTTDMLLVVDSQGRMTSPSSYRPSSDI